ncbi:MAG: YkgJ family cysteine cluster protein [Candidatus Diapherotrites archaeon]
MTRDFACERCGACCRRYWVTILPEELNRGANMLKIPEKEFVEKYTRLFLQIFPTDYRENSLEIFNEFLPKWASKKIENQLGYLPQHFLVLPTLVLKRNGNDCVFYSGENGCKIHGEKPKQCGLFPFISLDGKKDFENVYLFCPGLKKQANSKKGWKNLGDLHYNEIKDYFESVKKKGFLKMWNYLPEEGLILLKNKIVGEISQKEFLKSIEPFK